ncbi:DNA-binding response regulator [Alteromonadales bacterium alter-6D02]|nr:DNA-binding response regulator [Alteromonadales bacterium alter-6D02]
MHLTNAHILVVEDDQRLNQMMTEMLRAQSYQVSCVYDGLQAIEQINQNKPDIILLDMMLPGCDGLQVLRSINSSFSGIIIMITAQQNDFLEVSALNLGVHDYICKPVRPHILLARIRALSRLNQSNNISETAINSLRVQDLELNLNARQVSVAEQPIELSDAEFDLLSYFMRYPNTILSRDVLIGEVRNLAYDGFDRSIDMRISALRKKLQDSQPPYKYIKTVRAKGYILVLE